MKALSIQQLHLLHLGPVSFTIQAGETCSLTGPSGIGKSLLLRAMVDLIPHEGEVSFGEQSCHQTRPAEWRKLIGLLPAESFWWCDRVGAHFAPLTDEQRDWFSNLGMTEEVLDWDVARCSTGERQRLALLRLLCHGPKALLLDEPTANLDGNTSLQVEQLILAYQQQHQAPILWVTHDQTQAERVAQCQLQINSDGQIREVQA